MRDRTGQYLLFGLVVESYIAKSMLFKAMPLSIAIPAHYAISVLALLVIGVLGLTMKNTNRYRADKLTLQILAGLLFWLSLTALCQEAALLNFGAVLLLALLVGTTVVVVPRFGLANVSRYVFAAFLFCSRVFLTLSLLLLLFAPSIAFDENDRFQGVAESVAVACGMTQIAVPLLLAAWLADRRSVVRFLFFIASLTIGVLTRSRATIIVCLAISLVILLVNCKVGLGKKVIVFALAAAIAVTVAVPMLADMSQETQQNLIVFLRLSDDEIAQARTPHWEAGLARISENGLLGLGLLSRFTSKGDIAFDLRRNESTYDVSMDPHNCLIQIGQAAGYPAMLILAALILRTAYLMLRYATRTTLESNPYGVVGAWACFVYLGLSTVSPSFLSFGSILDRHFYIMLGITLPAVSYWHGAIPKIRRVARRNFQ